MARAYRCRPSEVLGVSDRLTAFYLDRAVYALAGRIQSEMDNLKGDERAHLKLPMILNKWGLTQPGRSGFADPTQIKRQRRE